MCEGKRLFFTSLKQTCNEYLYLHINKCKLACLDNRETSPCSLCALNLLHLLPSRMVGWHKLCSPVFSYVLLFAIFSLSSPTCFSYFPLLPTFSFLCFFIFFPNSPTSILPFFPIIPIFPYFPLNIFFYTLFPSRKLEVGDLINKLI